MKRIILALLVFTLFVLFVNGSLAQQGSAIEFSGNAADQVEAKDSPSFDINGKAFTMEAWVFPTAVGGGLIIVNKEDSYEMALNQGALFYAVSAGNWKWWGGGNVELNTWSHVAVTYDGKETTGWINGQEANSTNENSANISPNNEPFNIGWRPFDTHSPFIGIIDEVRISKSVRYTEDFDVPTEEFERDDDTVALYHLNEGAGEVAEDISGNENHAELIGEPKWVESTVPLALAVKPKGKLAIMWGAVKVIR